MICDLFPEDPTSKGAKAQNTSRTQGKKNQPAFIKFFFFFLLGRTSHALAQSVDLLPTFLALAGGTLPQDRLYV